MTTYNCIAYGRILNSKPLTLKEAEDFKSNCIMNYGYAPEIVPA